MASKLSETKGDAKGKGKANTSSATMETPFSLVFTRYPKELEEKHQYRLVVKKYVCKENVVSGLDIPEVASFVSYQHIDYFLQISQDYNEDLIYVFYSGLHAMKGSCFKFTIGKIVYEFTNELWKSLFGIIFVDADDDEANPFVMDINIHIHFKWNVHVNELLKDPCVEGCYDPITTGQLKMVPRILMWLVSHVLCLKNYGFLRIDFVEIHLVYIMLIKIKIN